MYTREYTLHLLLFFILWLSYHPWCRVFVDTQRLANKWWPRETRNIADRVQLSLHTVCTDSFESQVGNYRVFLSWALDRDCLPCFNQNCDRKSSVLFQDFIVLGAWGFDFRRGIGSVRLVISIVWTVWRSFSLLWVTWNRWVDTFWRKNRKKRDRVGYAIFAYKISISNFIQIPLISVFNNSASHTVSKNEKDYGHPMNSILSWYYLLPLLATPYFIFFRYNVRHDTRRLRKKFQTEESPRSLFLPSEILLVDLRSLPFQTPYKRSASGSSCPY